MAEALRGQRIVLLGEIHDNPQHHAVQAQAVDVLEPKAIVFEMMTAAQAEAAQAAERNQAAIAKATDWANSGWPDFAMYWPILAAAPEATVYGAAIPRTETREAFSKGAVALFNGDAAEFGLDQPLDPDEQSAREQAQFEAHCSAMPIDMMGGMVEVQRLRDAELARVALQALDQTGGPVAVILGAGHARNDWGVPVYLRRVAPNVPFASIGQTEGDEVGPFDLVLSAPPATRDDPCNAFR